jgi:hypothetical protein
VFGGVKEEGADERFQISCKTRLYGIASCVVPRHFLEWFCTSFFGHMGPPPWLGVMNPMKNKRLRRELGPVNPMRSILEKGAGLE